MLTNVLLGRDAEREQIGRLLATARLGVSGTLVVTGEPGVGKSALLDDALSGQDEMRVLRATGLEAERHLPFAGLLQLLRPALDGLDELPPPQAAALSAALAVSEPGGGSGDRFAIGAAVLSLWCRYAEEGPVAVVIDDLHALDLPSAEAIVFAARRLAADPVAVLAAARSPEADRLVAGLPVLRLAGLDDDAATALVARAAGGAMARQRLEPLLRLAGGNPLALLELAGDDLDALAIDPAELPVRVPEAVTAAFARRLDRLDEGCRTALLVAAVAAGDLPVIAQACAALGADADALARAEDDGLVSVRAGRVSYRHPLLRAAAYSHAPARDRRAAHRAVADALPEADADRRAWHLAESVWQPDAAVSDLLAQAADRAAARTAYSVASGAYERSARLCPDLGGRTDRLLAAAETAWSAGLTERTLGLLDSHAREGPAEEGQVRALALRGAVAARTGRLQDARELLLAAAGLATNPDEETVILADAVNVNFYLAGASVASRLADRLAELAPSVRGARARALGLIATGMARILAGQTGGADDLRAAVPLLESTPELYRDPHRLSFVMQVPLFLRDATRARGLRELVDAVRGLAGVGALPAVLSLVARDQSTTSAWAEAEANYAEAIRLAEETGQTTDRLMSVAGLCWLESRQGREDGCRAHADEVLSAPTTTHLHMAEAWVRYARGDLELSLGDPARAVAELRELEALLDVHELADVDLRPGPELVDALIRVGKQEEAESAAAAYLRAAQAKGQPWALARAARAEGLVAHGPADRAFAAAIEAHAATVDRFETARTMLAYGARLRREARRVDARVQLRSALDDFEDLGAARWAELTASELNATGETVRRRDADPLTALTPQELQVCLLLVEGRTTREAAAALFLSPKTVEYHLRKVYTKLGIRSRRELAEALSGAPSR